MYKKNFDKFKFEAAKARKMYAAKLLTEKKLLPGFESIDQFKKIFKQKVDGIINNKKIRIATTKQDREVFKDLLLNDNIDNPEDSEWFDIIDRVDTYIKCTLNTDNIENWKGTSLAQSIIAHFDKIKGYKFKVIPESFIKGDYKIEGAIIYIPRKFFIKDKETQITASIPYSLNNDFPGFMEVFNF